MTTSDNESARGMEQGSMGETLPSHTTFRCQNTTVFCAFGGSTSIAIVPRGIGEDCPSWEVGEEKIPAETLEDAIVVARAIHERAKEDA